jgi:hypothetical protein
VKLAPWTVMAKSPATLSLACLAYPTVGCEQEVKSNMSFRWPRWAKVGVVIVLVAAVIVGVPAVREPILRAAGWALVVREPVAPSDIIVISLDAGGAGALEAADLVQSGIAPQVAVFADPPNGEDHEFIRRGLPYEDAASRQIRQLALVGVRNVVRIPEQTLELRARARCFRPGVTSTTSVQL